jgi:hypothetical protein
MSCFFVTLTRMIWHDIYRDLSQGEKHSEIKPTLEAGA